jgi:hypothetical protein
LSPPNVFLSLGASKIFILHLHYKYSIISFNFN